MFTFDLLIPITTKIKVVSKTAGTPATKYLKGCDDDKDDVNYNDINNHHCDDY